MTQTDKAKAFKAMHVRGAPLMLYNIWDGPRGGKGGGQGAGDW